MFQGYPFYGYPFIQNPDVHKHSYNFKEYVKILNNYTFKGFPTLSETQVKKMQKLNNHNFEDLLHINKHELPRYFKDIIVFVKEVKNGNHKQLKEIVLPELTIERLNKEYTYSNMVKNHSLIKVMNGFVE